MPETKKNNVFVRMPCQQLQSEKKVVEIVAHCFAACGADAGLPDSTILLILLSADCKALRSTYLVRMSAGFASPKNLQQLNVLRPDLGLYPHVFAV